MRSAFHGLYAQLAAALIALLAVVALSYAGLSQLLAEQDHERGQQALQRDIAEHLRDEMHLLQQGVLDEQRVEQLMHAAMLINPAIEIYLLDTKGQIRAYSAPPGAVVRERVSLVPIRAFLAGDNMYPLLGDDPRGSDRQKVFSAAELPGIAGASGYLYVVLQSEIQDAVLASQRDQTLTWLGATALAGSLGVGLLVGLWLFHRITHRLRSLNRRMRHYRESGYRDAPEAKGSGHDEIADLEREFSALSQQVTHQLDELARQDALRRELVANVSHDLRTPLAALHGYLETLQQRQSRLSDEERDHYLDVAQRHSRRLARLIDDLFELAKLEASDIEPQREAFSLAELVHDIIQQYQLPARRAGITLGIDCPDGLPFVDADIALIERALTNLLDNALQHTPSGGTVSISLKPRQAGIEVSVSDTGKGISPDALPHVFRRFYRAGDAHRGEGKHAGLGLAITRRIIELHGQHIAARSELGRGTDFRFNLPAVA